MIATVFACLVAYAAGSFAAPAAGWEGVRLAYSANRSPLARTILITAVEAFVGAGTAGLGIALSTLTPNPDEATLLAASAVGLGFGVARSIRSARIATTSQEAAATLGAPEAAEPIRSVLTRIIRFAVLVRILAAAMAPLATMLLG